MRRFFGVTFIIVLLSITLVFCIHCYINSPRYVEKQELRVSSIYQDCKAQLNNMIEYLEANTINILECRQDGYLLLDNQTYTWIPEISPTIKMLYNINNGENNIQDIYFKREPTGLSMTIYNYFPENSMEICLVYSCEDLTNNNEMYSKIEGKWFLCTLGLT